MLSIFSYFVIGFASKKEYAIGAIFFTFYTKINIYSETLFLIYITKKIPCLFKIKILKDTHKTKGKL